MGQGIEGQAAGQARGIIAKTVGDKGMRKLMYSKSQNQSDGSDNKNGKVKVC